ncbi:biotin--[acetyl-CoA-carboxylase] ligase [Sulfurirhabdus autotrophica]|uniref:Bifunctional ligase/repressor BirA n=1 Tax=Sulfurirhabdus autotrophica TaxID=1706046 RepID=A0A4R3XTP4_9PROT|nr:biotin--[acetyl-CoA-carboxylase] ligase [Sulfurirhabdus autotrophica]TCV83045.1 BirA family biotin operon repressor/biotin-[acetyl-CoA-carboxylase] ligase [Sulfurirhabdus autotrophica]
MKPLTFSILRLLSDGNFHSGEALAQYLGVSRASISNGLKTLGELGVNIYKIRGRGYCLQDPLQWLDKQLILDFLGTSAKDFNIEVHDVMDSSNSLLLQDASKGLEHRSCYVVELQLQGRGRRGRAWHMNLGGALTFSLLWRFNQCAGYLSGLSLAVGVALVRSLRDLGLVGVALKWPNDVLYQYQKMAGILIELQGDVLGPSAAVIGIGLNLRLSPSVRCKIDQAVTDFSTVSGEMPDRNAVLASLLININEVLRVFEKSGFSALRNEWISYHVYHNRSVRILMPGGETREGDVIDVDIDGSLVVKTSIGKERFSSGEISLRGSL